MCVCVSLDVHANGRCDHLPPVAVCALASPLARVVPPPPAGAGPQRNLQTSSSAATTMACHHTAAMRGAAAQRAGMPSGAQLAPTPSSSRLAPLRSGGRASVVAAAKGSQKNEGLYFEYEPVDPNVAKEPVMQRGARYAAAFTCLLSGAHARLHAAPCVPAPRAHEHSRWAGRTRCGWWMGGGWASAPAQSRTPRASAWPAARPRPPAQSSPPTPQPGRPPMRAEQLENEFGWVKRSRTASSKHRAMRSGPMQAARPKPPAQQQQRQAPRRILQQGEAAAAAEEGPADAAAAGGRVWAGGCLCGVVWWLCDGG